MRPERSEGRGAERQPTTSVPRRETESLVIIFSMVRLGLSV